MKIDWVDDLLSRSRPAFPGLDFETEAISARILLIHELMRARQRAFLAEHGLTHEEYDVLTLLVNNHDSASPGTIGRELGLTTGAVTNRVDRLEKKGYVTRRPDPRDRRSLQVQMTPTGRKARTDAVLAAGKGESVVVQTLTERERTQLIRLLRKLVLAYGGVPGRSRFSFRRGE